MDRSSTQLQLSGDQITALASEWDGDALWQDVRWLASQTWRSEGRDRTVAWHHLCMTVGNFKRQPGRRLDPGRLDDGAPPSPPGETLVIDLEPGAPLELGRDDSATWSSLRSRHGFGTATTTTVLAALWPDDHLICDWRVVYACAALAIAEDPTACPFGIDPDSSEPIDLDLVAIYTTVRAVCSATARATGQPLVSVERALYCLSRRVDDEPGRSWKAYADAISAALPHQS